MTSENKKTRRQLDIFISSPGDMQKEREIAIQVINRLNDLPQIARQFVLKPLAYEKSVPPAVGQSPVNTIDHYMMKAGKADIYICILWHRWGTPVVDDNGAKWQSGTEYEFFSAYRANQETGKPRMLLYHCIEPIPPEADREQWKMVQEFLKRFIGEKADLKGLWHEYQAEKFEETLFQHLAKIIDKDFDQLESETSTALPIDDRLQAYRAYLINRVSTLRFFNEAKTRQLQDVFIELTLTEEYERPAANAQWLGMMDSELRRRRDIFARDDEDREPDSLEKERRKERRTLKPDELLHRRTQAVIVGAPGCGKTTLLRYLALNKLPEKFEAGKPFPVFLELKSISEKAFEEVDGNLAELLFAKAVATPLGLTAVESERLKTFFLARLKAGEVTILLDGLDEVSGATVFSVLCRSVNEFMASDYRHNNLIISTRPYALQQRFEGLHEMEIAVLNPRQVEAFLQHYYGDDPSTKKLQQELRRRRELREMARVPFLLSVIAYLHRPQGEIVRERLELYRQLVHQLVTQLDREKNAEQRFCLKDPGGLHKLNFVKRLAYERLFVDEVDQDAERLILTKEIIDDKACSYCQTFSKIDPSLLATDVKATPLLREIGADAFTFSHLTLQEYLAAITLAEQPDCEKIFCRAYFNPTLAEMEVLPMALGLMRKPRDADSFYALLEDLPESLNFANLRLRAKGLAYVKKIGKRLLANLTDRLIEVIADKSPYADAVIKCFTPAKGSISDFIVDRVGPLLDHEDDEVCTRAVRMLGQVGSAHAVATLLDALKQGGLCVAPKVGATLGDIADESVVEELIRLLKHGNSDTRRGAAIALGNIGDKRAVLPLMAALKKGEIFEVGDVATALGIIGDMRAVEALIEVGENSDSLWEMDRWSVFHALETLDSKRAKEVKAPVVSKNIMEILSSFNLDTEHRILKAQAERRARLEILLQEYEPTAMDYGQSEELSVISDLAHGDVQQRTTAAIRLLVMKGDKRAVDALAEALHDEEWLVRSFAAEALGEIGDQRAVGVLADALFDEHSLVCEAAAKSLGKIGGEQAVLALLHALKNGKSEVQVRATEALGKIGDLRVFRPLLSQLKEKDSGARESAARALQALTRSGDPRTIAPLLTVLNGNDSNARKSAAEILGVIDHKVMARGLRRSLSCERRFVRQKAAQIVGYYTTDKQVLATLQHMIANDPAEKVRTVAREAAEKYAIKLQYFVE